MTTPVVGIAGYHHVVARPWGTLPVSGAPTAYVEAVRAAGGLPVLLPQDDALGLLGVVDGLVLAGGGDVDPTLYGGEAGTAREVDPARDAAEVAVVRAAVRTTALHHQAVADAGPRWRATAWTGDGTIEALEPVDDLSVLGVQWHPELSHAPFADPTGSAMFGWLVAEARTRQAAPRLGSREEVRGARPIAARHG